MSDELRIDLTDGSDMVQARAAARELAGRLGFTKTDATLIATAVSEIARNVVVHAGEGHLVMTAVREQRRFGLRVVAVDAGPGIRDVPTALENGYAGRGGLGLGLPGARRLMDDFDVRSEPERGTMVTMTKWRQRDELELLRERHNHGSS